MHHHHTKQKRKRSGTEHYFVQKKSIQVYLILNTEQEDEKQCKSPKKTQRTSTGFATYKVAETRCKEESSQGAPQPYHAPEHRKGMETSPPHAIGCATS